MSDLEAVQSALSSYPQTVTLHNDQEIELKPARVGNKNAIVKFAKNLDEQDLLFLRVDITEPDVVDNWLNNIKSGATVSILAWSGKEVVGYCTVDRTPARWTRRVGEIRVNIAPALRGLGLGRQLVSKVFDVAQHLGLKKIMANMTPDQPGAQAAFTRLGFRPEALLVDYVEDRSGGVHDLVILSYNVDGLSGQLDAPLRI